MFDEPSLIMDACGKWARMKLFYGGKKIGKLLKFCSFHSLEPMKNRQNSAYLLQLTTTYCLHTCLCLRRKRYKSKRVFTFFRVLNEKFHMWNAKRVVERELEKVGQGWIEKSQLQFQHTKSHFIKIVTFVCTPHTHRSPSAIICCV